MVSMNANIMPVRLDMNVAHPLAKALQSAQPVAMQFGKMPAAATQVSPQTQVFTKEQATTVKPYDRQERLASPAVSAPLVSRLNLQA